MATFRLRPPHLPAGLVARPRLTGAVLATGPGEACVVSAPRGYGVTTLLAQALGSTTDAVCWVSLDGQVTDAEARDLLGGAVGAAARGLDGVLAAVEQAGPAWVAVDGVTERQPGFCEDVVALAAHLPAAARLVVASPHRFPLLPRAAHLETEDLAFTDDEALALLHSIEPGTDIEDARVILDAAQGWAAALVAAASRLRQEGGAEWLLSGGAGALLGGWFRRLPSDQRDLLVATSALDLLSADVASAVSQRPDAAEILLRLEAENAYLTEVPAPPGHTGRWWRRHRMLTAYLDQLAGPSRAAAHSRAADWFRAAGDVRETMSHLIAAGRRQEAGTYLFEHESRLLSSGRSAQVLDWYERTSDGTPRAVHQLRLAWGQTLSGDIRGADATVAQLEAELRDQPELDPPDPPRSWGAEVALVRGYLAGYHGDPATMVKGARRLITEQSNVGNADAEQLAPIMLTEGLLWSGKPEAAARALEEEGNRPYPNDMLREIHLVAVRALVNLAVGEVRRAQVQADAAAAWLDRTGAKADLMQFGATVTACAGVALERGDVERATQLAEQVLEEALRCGHISAAVWADLVLGRIHLAVGDVGAAARVASRVRTLATRDTPDTALCVPVDQFRAEVFLAAGDSLRAERVIRGLPASTTRSLLWAHAGLTRHPVAARRALETLGAGTPRTQAQRHLLLAAVYARGSRSMAQGHLRKAARIAQAHGIGQLLAAADPGLVEFARSCAMEHQDDNLDWLLQNRPSSRPAAGTSGPQTPLSRGELQLLSVLPTRARNAEIAAGLGVSVNTVKTRLRRLYVKLGAGSRDEAIERARERGLLTD